MDGVNPIASGIIGLRAKETATKESSTGCCCGCNSKDAVDLVDDHVSDKIDNEILNQSSVFDDVTVLCAGTVSFLDAICS